MRKTIEEIKNELRPGDVIYIEHNTVRKGEYDGYYVVRENEDVGLFASNITIGGWTSFSIDSFYTKIIKFNVTKGKLNEFMTDAVEHTSLESMMDKHKYEILRGRAPKEMTLAEISEKLGYEVKIVK